MCLFSERLNCLVETSIIHLYSYKSFFKTFLSYFTPPPLRPKKIIIVWLSSTTFFEKGRVGRFFFFKSKSKLHGIIGSISPNKGAHSLLYQKYLHTSLKPVLECKQPKCRKVLVYRSKLKLYSLDIFRFLSGILFTLTVVMWCF